MGVYDGHAWAAMALGMATDFKFHVVGPFPFLFVPPDRKFNTNAGLSSAAGILELVVPTPMFLVQRAATQAAAARLKEEVSLPHVFFRIGFASCDDVASLFPWLRQVSYQEHMVNVSIRSAMIKDIIL